jgi:hypothetical protein
VFPDILMMVITGGQHRTEDEFKALFDATGFRLTKVISTESGGNIVEGIPV